MPEVPVRKGNEIFRHETIAAVDSWGKDKDSGHRAVWNGLRGIADFDQGYFWCVRMLVYAGGVSS